MGDFNRASSIEPSSGLINQQGSSSIFNSFSDLGRQRTITCTFSLIEVDFVEKEGFKEGLVCDMLGLLLLDFEDEEVGEGYAVDSFHSGVEGGVIGRSVCTVMFFVYQNQKRSYKSKKRERERNEWFHGKRGEEPVCTLLNQQSNFHK